jgi:predicted nucleotidyltransferase
LPLVRSVKTVLAKKAIDLLVSFNPREAGDYADTYFDLADKFGHLFRRPVDLITDKSLSNPYFNVNYELKTAFSLYRGRFAV